MLIIDGGSKADTIGIELACSTPAFALQLYMTESADATSSGTLRCDVKQCTRGLRILMSHMRTVLSAPHENNCEVGDAVDIAPRCRRLSKLIAVTAMDE